MCDGKKADGIVGEAAVFRGCDAVFDFWMMRRGGDLFRAGIGCDDVIKAFGEIERGLTVAGGAVPDERGSRHERCEVIEDCRGIMRAKIGVAGGEAGEMIVKGLGHGFQMGLVFAE